MDWEAHCKGCSNLKLSEPEFRYYGDIFIYCCKNSEPDQVPSVKVGELLRTANLPCDETLKILELCGAAKFNTLNRKQFFAALKLVAACQAGLEVHPNLILSQLDDISLPKFQWPSSSNEEGEKLKKRYHKKSSKRNRHLESTTESDSEAESPRETEGCSTDSPTPTNSVTQERNEGIIGDEINVDSVSGGWQSLLVSEEQRQLLGTEEESSERHSSDDAEGENGDGLQSSMVWTITDEQREYYNAQFAQLQPNPEGLLAGSIARKYFEKSRLPVEELRKIWQLADVTRDSALSLQEFYIAMHLTVVRRHHLQLPDVLPLTLANELLAQKNPPSTVPPVPAPRGSPHKAQREKSKEWTKFVDSPTGNNGGSLTSPGPKPVNFDFIKAAVERDPKILHPVALRLTPEAAILASNANGNNGAVPLLGDEDLLIQRPLAKKAVVSLVDETSMATPKKEPPPPPPPRPYRTHTRSSSLDLNKLGKNGQNFPGAPPTVPPRVSPGITNTRKLVGQKSEGEGSRSSNNGDEQDFVADFSHFAPKTGENQTAENNVQRSSGQFAGVCGAFHIYKKPTSRKSDDDGAKDDIDTPKLTLQELREVNAELRQVCEELTAEWAGALQEKVNLKAKLLLHKNCNQLKI